MINKHVDEGLVASVQMVDLVGELAVENVDLIQHLAEVDTVVAEHTHGYENFGNLRDSLRLHGLGGLQQDAGVPQKP